ncbi:MAG: hypothetical protein KGR48_15190 [Alphaproteobacteria bacterium]|nr:hypothetical protein [Alphaproteobacteria bacterium]MBU6472902.1 hypothetical protein [Alphaproteobacteria bacterium]MDE2013234.1 hypothetical protein [Alphaproteobacteria bacterium]MDE2074038.1 hypothetical protein [Alphaproteobacteria bacterium]
MRLAAFALLAAMFCTGAAVADAIATPTPLQLYQTGKYAEAIAQGTASNAASGYAVAARAELAKEMMRDQPCLDCLKTAEGYARQSIALDPTLADGHVYLAAALGYESRIIGIMAAKFKGYAGEAKNSLDVAFAHHPDDPWVLAALGGWNIAVVDGGGATMADWMYGATVKQGLDDYAKAFAADPTEIVLRFQYVLSLSTYNREAYAKQIGAALQLAATGKPRTVYEQFMQGRAKTLLAAFQRSDWKAYDALVRRYQGYPQ